MRRFLLRFALPVALLPVTGLLAQEVQGPEPGVYVYEYDEATDRFDRTYFSSQQEARAALEPWWNHGRAMAAQLNQQAQSDVNAQAVAEWLVFYQQWLYWQGWVLQEYVPDISKDDTVDLGDSVLEGQFMLPVPFQPRTGLKLRYGLIPVRSTEQPAQQGNQQGGGGRAGGGERDGGAVNQIALEGAGGEFGQFGGTNQNQNEAPAAPNIPADISINTFMPLDEGSQYAVIQQVQDGVQMKINEMAEESYEVLDAVLASVHERSEMRNRRAAYIGMRQREITDLAEIILNRRSATELEIGGTLYLFSDKPLSRIPDGAVNIDTPNLTPYDIFNSAGAVREVSQ